MAKGNEALPSFESPESGVLPERKIIVDYDQVELVLGKLVCAFENEDYPYSLDSTRVPQDHRHMPQSLEFNTTEHAMFLWTVCYYMRGGIKSDDAVKRLAKIYDNSPELFVADVARTMQPADIAKVLKENSLGFQDTVGRAWVENADRLQKKWDGDPRNIFNGVASYQESLDRIKNDGKGGGFIGFQEKMVSMIIYYLADEGLIKEFEFPLPVDIHVLRVSIANELVKFQGYSDDENVFSDELLEVVRNLFVDYTRKHNVDMLRLCDAVWLLSQSICGIQPGNITLEPEGRKNRNGRSTVLEPLPIDINNEDQRIAYHKACGQCPVEDTCKWNVPGKTYYVQGALARRGERVIYPKPSQEKLF